MLNGVLQCAALCIIFKFPYILTLESSNSGSTIIQAIFQQEELTGARRFGFTFVRQCHHSYVFVIIKYHLVCQLVLGKINYSDTVWHFDTFP